MQLPRPVYLGVLAIALVSGCSQPVSQESADLSAGSSTSTDVVSPSPTAAPLSTPSPIPSPTVESTVERTLNPLTGLPFIKLPLPAQFAGMPAVLAVKIDNTRNAQPQAGVGLADLVYVEEVEYGMTRLAAIFSSTIPARIGPVRSARITDIDLLAQYGSPAFAFSGAQRKLWPALDKATFIDVSANKVPQDYSRDSTRRAPYNYFFDAVSALSQVEGVSRAKEMGFTFDKAIPRGGSIAQGVDLAWPSSSLQFRYNPARNQYAVQLNGERAKVEKSDPGGSQVWADTAVVQLVEQKQSAYFDKGGGNTPQVETIGSGAAIILRDGQLFNATWDRSDAESGTTFTDSLGNQVPFHPGHTWIALYNMDREVVVKTA
ncbi:MAG: DUF3048 domain-containing protein [Actinomycetia bacterium]|nr:DUF3048 domain-containing protein [Actinomycetes bacterium]